MCSKELVRNESETPSLVLVELLSFLLRRILLFFLAFWLLLD